MEVKQTRNKKDFCLRNKIFMITLKEKPRELFKVNVWLREDSLKLVSLKRTIQCFARRATEPLREPFRQCRAWSELCAEHSKNMGSEWLWITAHAGFLWTRFDVGRDGRTA